MPDAEELEARIAVLRGLVEDLLVWKNGTMPCDDCVHCGCEQQRRVRAALAGDAGVRFLKELRAYREAISLKRVAAGLTR
jgi:hypothetical protein